MIKKILVSFFIFIISLNLSFSRAQVRCQLGERTQQNFTKQSGVNLVSTSVASSTFGFIGTLSQVFASTTFENLNKCSAQKLSDITNGAATLGEGCEDVDAEVCESIGIFNEIRDGSTTNNTSGSILGYAIRLEEGLKEPLPVSFAYYINQNVQKIPGLQNTAFAQDTIDYGGPFLSIIYRYWTLSRNIAYAFLAVAMTIIGILIIMGKSIDPKMAVTVQQALPQIIIALTLITFSYPIGAAGASLAFNLRGSIQTSDLFADVSKMDVSSAAVISMLVTPVGWATGAIVIILGLVAGLVSAIMGLLVLLKMFGIYLKMLFAIITAPVSFAIGAIPGNQDTTLNWFKQFGAYIVTLPAMSFACWVVWALIYDVGLETINSLGGLAGFGLGSLAGIAMLVISFYGYSIVLTIPEKIEGMLGIKSK